ncbi:406_t:CDS:2 [Ambispora leptoticha]|uniref:Endopolyphosphatase n=1 Tax=Ambispora leptoticha TaxID=144679 RepID=A0A9N9ABR6_9GLOM|nr:406_t:CDS:2 [Ambispora leptoticha]
MQQPPPWLLVGTPLLILWTIWISTYTGTDLLNNSSPKLHGNFLHITDLHPDPNYKTNATARSSCHRRKNDTSILKKPPHMKVGRSGAWGAPATICDTPIRLINATFDWLATNWADNLDFIIWTGDSSRHDSDEKKPRKFEEILELNQMMADKFLTAFSATKHLHPRRNKKAPKLIPIVPSLGNNDVYPSNIIEQGPNNILDSYMNIWSPFIPKSQLDSFKRGGYYVSEVIPKKLIVVSMNTLYFFESNTAVRGCQAPDEPGTIEMQWLNKVLHKARKKGMKAYVIGHVAPSKKRYTRSCWNKYGRIAHKYHDIILGHLYGHANMDHFYFIRSKSGKTKTPFSPTINSKEDDSNYETIVEEESNTAEPVEPSSSSLSEEVQTEENGEDDKVKANVYDIDNYVHRLLDHYKEVPPITEKMAYDYSVINVNPSVIPTFFPALRIYQYNTTELTNVNNVDTTSKKSYKEANENPHQIPEYEVEYTTKGDYQMTDLTINSWLGLARRIAGDGIKGKLWKKFRNHIMVGTRDVVKNRKAVMKCEQGRDCSRVKAPEDYLASLGEY